MSKGAPASKLVVGIPTYGQSFTLSTGSTAPGSPAGGAGTGGSITQQPGFLSYQEICLSTGWTVVEDPTEKRGPYAYKGNQWVGYDDPKTAAIKVSLGWGDGPMHKLATGGSVTTTFKRL